MTKQYPGITDKETLAERIREIGFCCLGCGDCCRTGKEDDNLVMVFPPEVRRIARVTGIPIQAVAEPFPEEMEAGNGSTLTFGWALRRSEEECTFYQGGRCSIYRERPRICRTYPFMVHGGTLHVFPCRGLGLPVGEEEARIMARDLLERQAAEEEEEERVRQVLTESTLPPQARLLVDSEGVRVL